MRVWLRKYNFAIFTKGRVAFVLLAVEYQLEAATLAADHFDHLCSRWIVWIRIYCRHFVWIATVAHFFFAFTFAAVTRFTIPMSARRSSVAAMLIIAVRFRPAEASMAFSISAIVFFRFRPSIAVVTILRFNNYFGGIPSRIRYCDDERADRQRENERSPHVELSII
jgi:hypothetical protein